ncbi:MAG TPA: hypothetical protein DGG94_21600, partial [Micromonosporaceae bacterium]|nr:hypothetical protein [Micromonosporaceae bacterium]
RTKKVFLEWRSCSALGAYADPRGVSEDHDHSHSQRDRDNSVATIRCGRKRHLRSSLREMHQSSEESVDAYYTGRVTKP